MKRKFIATPRWYSYGGLFQSLCIALKIAKHYGCKIVLTYPSVHRPSKVHQYNTPALLCEPLKHFKCEGVEVVGVGSLLSNLLTAWVNVSRRLTNRLIGRVLSKLKLNRFFMPCTIGYTGLESGNVEKQLKLTTPVDWRSVLNTPIQVDLTEEQEAEGRKEFERLNIPEGKPFVCLYVRDNGYRARADQPGSDYLNAEISAFGKTVTHLNKIGYSVIRVRDPSMKMLPDEIEALDYVHHAAYSDLLNLYLHRHCAFWMGTIGGGRWVPTFYGRDAITVNAIEVPYCATNLKESDIFISKHVFSKKEGRFLSLQEQLQNMEVLPPAAYDFENYVLIENSAEEILAVIQEFLDSKESDSFDWNDDLQNKYHALRKKRCRETYFDSAKEKWVNLSVEHYASVDSRVGKSFLENNWEYGPYLQSLTEQYKEGILSGAIQTKKTTGLTGILN